MQSGENNVNLNIYEAIPKNELSLISSRGKECFISWSYSGRFMVQAYGSNLMIIDAKK